MNTVDTVDKFDTVNMIDRMARVLDIVYPNSVVDLFARCRQKVTLARGRLERRTMRIIR